MSVDKHILHSLLWCVTLCLTLTDGNVGIFRKFLLVLISTPFLQTGHLFLDIKKANRRLRGGPHYRPSFFFTSLMHHLLLKLLPTLFIYVLISSPFFILVNLPNCLDITLQTSTS